MRNRGVHECWIIAATQVSPTNQNWILLLLVEESVVLAVIKTVGADSRLLSILKKWEIVNGHARLVVFIPVWRVMVACFVTLSPRGASLHLQLALIALISARKASINLLSQFRLSRLIVDIVSSAPVLTTD